MPMDPSVKKHEYKLVSQELQTNRATKVTFSASDGKRTVTDSLFVEARGGVMPSVSLDLLDRPQNGAGVTLRNRLDEAIAALVRDGK